MVRDLANFNTFRQRTVLPFDSSYLDRKCVRHKSRSFAWQFQIAEGDSIPLLEKKRAPKTQQKRELELLKILERAREDGLANKV